MLSWIEISSRSRVHVILCHEVVPMEMPQTPRQRVKILRESRHATEDPTAAVILSACISNPGDPLRSSGCSKM